MLNEIKIKCLPRDHFVVYNPKTISYTDQGIFYIVEKSQYQNTKLIMKDVMKLSHHEIQRIWSS